MLSANALQDVGKITHPLQYLHADSAAFLVCVLGPFKGILGYAICQITVCPPSERPAAKYELVGANTKRPPINVISVSTFS